MNKSREEIPLWTWYTGQLLFQFDEQLKKNPSQTISQFFSNFLINQGMQGRNFYHTKNQGTIILLMYGLIVIPREIWGKTTTDFRFATRSKFEIKIFPGNSDIDTLNFLRLLRNSLSHANFSIDTPNAKVTFWNDLNGIKNFEVEIGYSDLGEFLAEVGKYYLNEVKGKKGDPK